MAAFVRAKRVTDPLDEKVKALLCDGVYEEDISSGSEHEGASVLSGNHNGFFFAHMDEEEYDVGDGKGGDDGSGDDDGGEDEDATKPSVSSSFGKMIRDLVKNTRPDRFRNELNRVVSELVDKSSGMRHSRSVSQRNLMSSLRDSGYNAGICKAKWIGGDGVAAGNYQYIDVVRSEGKRYIVEVDFPGEFEIARPTEEYEELVTELPRVYIGKPEELKRVVRIMADAGKKSMRSRKMHVPPWRKVKFMQNKWFGSYKRTTNAIPASIAAEQSLTAKIRVDLGREIHCREVGFRLEKVVEVPPAKFVLLK